MRWLFTGKTKQLRSNMEATSLSAVVESKRVASLGVESCSFKDLHGGDNSKPEKTRGAHGVE